MPQFLLLEIISTVLLVLGGLGLVSDASEQPEALVKLYQTIPPTALLVLGLILSTLAIRFFLTWSKGRRASQLRGQRSKRSRGFATDDALDDDETDR